MSCIECAKRLKTDRYDGIIMTGHSVLDKETIEFLIEGMKHHENDAFAAAIRGASLVMWETPGFRKALDLGKEMEMDYTSSFYNRLLDNPFFRPVILEDTDFMVMLVNKNHHNEHVKCWLDSLVFKAKGGMNGTVDILRRLIPYH